MFNFLAKPTTYKKMTNLHLFWLQSFTSHSKSQKALITINWTGVESFFTTWKFFCFFLTIFVTHVDSHAGEQVINQQSGSIPYLEESKHVQTKKRRQRLQCILRYCHSVTNSATVSFNNPKIPGDVNSKKLLLQNRKHLKDFQPLHIILPMLNFCLLIRICMICSIYSMQILIYTLT